MISLFRPLFHYFPYIFYTFFFIENVVDSPVIKKIILVESNNVEIEKDTLLLVKDSLVVIKKE
jgi:hypothetical protein